MRNQENKIDVNSNGRNKQRSGVEANNTEQKKYERENKEEAKNELREENAHSQAMRVCMSEREKEREQYEHTPDKNNSARVK